MTLTDPEALIDCLDAGRSPCVGPVEYRWPGYGYRSWPRCQRHGDERIEKAQADNEKYPDSPFAPDWFDPTAAGETWDEPD